MCIFSRTEADEAEGLPAMPIITGIAQSRRETERLPNSQYYQLAIKAAFAPDAASLNAALNLMARELMERAQERAEAELDDDDKD
jgi:hypothetical protein